MAHPNEDEQLQNYLSAVEINTKINSKDDHELKYNCKTANENSQHTHENNIDQLTNPTLGEIATPADNIAYLVTLPKDASEKKDSQKEEIPQIKRQENIDTPIFKNCDSGEKVHKESFIGRSITEGKSSEFNEKSAIKTPLASREPHVPYIKKRLKIETTYEKKNHTNLSKSIDHQKEVGQKQQTPHFKDKNMQNSLSYRGIKTSNRCISPGIKTNSIGKPKNFTMEENITNINSIAKNVNDGKTSKGRDIVIKTGESMQSTNTFLQKKEQEAIVSELASIFGENLENFDEEILYQTLEDFNNKMLVRTLIFLSFDQNKRIQDLSKRLDEESEKNRNLSKELVDKNQIISNMESELDGVKNSLTKIIQNAGIPPDSKAGKPKDAGRSSSVKSKTTTVTKPEAGKERARPNGKMLELSKFISKKPEISK